MIYFGVGLAVGAVIGVMLAALVMAGQRDDNSKG